MSYILDALRRADAERERGAVPGLHTHQQPSRAEEPRTGKSSRLLLGLVIFLSLALAAVLTWNWLGTQTPPDVPIVVANPPPPVPTAAAPLAVPQAPAQPVPAQPAPQVLELPPPVPGTAPEPPRPAARKSEPAKPAPAPSAAAEPVRARPVVPLNELPVSVRRELPRLSVGGASYSENPASRMLILNGQVMYEGALVAPGLKLEQIQHKSAVLDFRGQRFRIDY
jgi:general secretion pathway protein B